jgi:hypothetical protein
MRRWAALAVLLTLVGCGRSPGLPAEVAAELRARAGAIRTAAGTGDRAGAEAALAELRRQVADLERAGRVSDRRAAEILSAAAEVETQLALLAAPAPPPPVTTTTPPTNLFEEWYGKGGKKKGHHDGGD